MLTAALSDWFPFLAYAFFALAIPLSMVAMSFIFAAPSRKSRSRVIPFESGVSQGPVSMQQKFTVSFYLTAMLFIVFDIEIVLLFPVAVDRRVVARRARPSGWWDQRHSRAPLRQM